MTADQVPDTDREQLAALADRRHGPILTQDLLHLGWSHDDIRRHPDLTPLTRGTYAVNLPDDPLDRHRLRSIAVALTNPTVCISHLSAAIMWQLPLLGPPPLDVHVMSVGPRASGWRTSAGIRHHGQPIDPDAVVIRSGVPVAPVARTVVDCGRVMPIAEAVILADAALHAGDVTVPQLRALLRGMRGWKGIGLARQVVALADPASESPGESRTRLLLYELGFRTRSQVNVHHESRFVGRADLAIEDTMVLVEFDGQGKYHLAGDPQGTFWAEKRRHDALTAAGYEVVRLTWQDLSEPTRVRQTVHAAIRRSAARHPTPHTLPVLGDAAAADARGTSVWQ